MTMNLLQNYLNAVRAYLPRSVDQKDILSELSAHLQIKFEEREEELGRSLTEDEQAEVLSQYGTPVVVAGRYGATSQGLSFGRQLIGPEIFLLYRRVLLAQLLLTLVVGTILRMLGAFGGRWTGMVGIMVTQFALTTTIFIAIDAFKQRSESRAGWNFPPAYLQPVPRWQSISGFVCLSVVALWWALVPYAPVLMLGSAVNRIELAPGWTAFYWPVLLPLLIGGTQRLITFVEPRKSWLQSFTRLVTNAWGVALVYPFMLATPYVVPIAGAGGDQLAARINSGAVVERASQSRPLLADQRRLHAVAVPAACVESSAGAPRSPDGPAVDARVMTSTTERLHALDAVRGFALLAGVVLHATMSFLPGFGAQGWPIVDRTPSVALGVTFFVIHIFRMTTFFMIAGFFAHLLYHRRGATRLRRATAPSHRRTARRRMDRGVPDDRRRVRVGGVLVGTAPCR